VTRRFRNADIPWNDNIIDFTLKKLFYFLGNLLRKIRLEICVNDDFVDATLNAIMTGARTGETGDGKIFILPMEDCLRIRTGEKGKVAVG